MGIGAVRSHSLSKKYKSQTALKGVTDIRSCFAPGVASTSNSSTSSTSSILSVLYNTLSADILWALEMFKCNFSGQSCDNKFLFFQRMFPDSSISKSCSMQRTKFTYTVNFGLVPFFFSEILEKKPFFYNFI